MAKLRFFCSKDKLDALMQAHGIREPEYIASVYPELDVAGYGENHEFVSFIVCGNMESARALVQRLEGGFF